VFEALVSQGESTLRMPVGVIQSDYSDSLSWARLESGAPSRFLIPARRDVSDRVESRCTVESARSRRL